MIEDKIATDEHWPDAADLLPWGDIDLIPMFCWDRTSSADPNQWQTVVFDTDEVRIERVDSTMSDCIRDFVLGTLDFDFIDVSALRRRPLTMVLDVSLVEAAFRDDRASVTASRTGSAHRSCPQLPRDDARPWVRVVPAGCTE